jgi:hypothetical protein
MLSVAVLCWPSNQVELNQCKGLLGYELFKLL